MACDGGRVEFTLVQSDWWLTQNQFPPNVFHRIAVVVWMISLAKLEFRCKER